MTQLNSVADDSKFIYYYDCDMSLFYVVLLVIERTLNVDDIQIFDVYFTGMQFFLFLCIVTLIVPFGQTSTVTICIRSIAFWRSALVKAILFTTVSILIINIIWPNNNWCFN